MSCYQTSCCCIPFRAIAACFGCDSPTLPPAVSIEVKPPAIPVETVLQTATSKLAVNALGQVTLSPSHPLHHRDRTWHLSNGRLAYRVSHSVTRPNFDDGS